MVKINWSICIRIEFYGGFASVFRARLEDSNSNMHDVALKVFMKYETIKALPKENDRIIKFYGIARREECWQDNLTECPDIIQVVNRLEQITLEEEDDISVEVANINDEDDIINDYGEGTFYKVIDVVAPYILLFDIAMKLIKEILELHYMAQYNKNISARLMERVLDAQRFMNTLVKIKRFNEELSNKGNFRKIIEANLIKDRFISLTDEFDAAMKDLSFSMLVDNEEQRNKDYESLEEDIEKMNKVDVVIDKVEKVVQEVQVLKSQLSDKLIFKPLIIESVECKPINISKNREVQTYFAILSKLGVCPYILKFHRLSKIKGIDIQVLEWTELGSLEDSYNQYDIGWKAKIVFTRDICRGIAFLNSVNVYHHDIRCKNIMLTSRYEAKIANFDMARESQEQSREIPDLSILRWIAPEKIKGKRFDTKCKIFSFGMMLWELSFEKYPYSKKSLEEIKNYVTGGYRERIIFAWHQYLNQRINLGELLIQMEELYGNHVESGALLQIYPNKKLDLDGTRYSEDFEDLEDFTIYNNNNIKIIMPFEEGLKIYQQIRKNEFSEEINKKRKVAWECFSDNADLGNPTAKYWKGYYLWEGYYVQKNREEAVKLFKEAANNGVSGAQLRYAFSILSNREKVSSANIQEFIKYLTLAADNGNYVALYNLGDLYINGKFNIKKDHDLGILKLKLAASYGNDAAKKLLEQLEH
ncbi:14210_t:CDS:10 [Gigaspora margarita]|uniref:14210_t:CDS:1 n=1 Tax=Gigaspora margarita TaxID=4874 RepID=A0ABN7UJ52_GIGMA|nr:14210_t:CDS:10 [Gigaspora margarita]